MDRLILVVTCIHLVSSWTIRIPSDENVELLNDIEDQSELNVIFPGTKWCGAGNTASDYNDLGRWNLTDACCRDHDLCPDLIESGGSAHGLTNTAPYTRLSCECDIKFLNCLKKTSRQQKASKFVGVIYFDALYTQCYRYEYPVKKCSQWFAKRCIEYEYDTTANKTWQWFDVPFFLIK